MADLSIVIPAHDEAQTLPALLRRLGAVLDSLEKSRGIRGEVVIVDDGSSDGSADVLRDAAGRDSRIRVITQARRRGQHEAIIAGFTRCAAPLVVSMDADLQNPPEEIPRIVDVLAGGADLVVTRRARRRDPPWRILSARFANATSSLLSRRIVMAPPRDIGCMLRGYSGELAARIVGEAGRAPRRGRGFPLVTVLALRFAREMREIDVAHERRRHGRSRYRLPDLLALYARLLLALLAGNRHGRR